MDAGIVIVVVIGAAVAGFAQGVTGKLVPGVWGQFLLIVLPALAGVLLFRRLTTQVFRRVVLIGLIASGVALLAGSVPALLA